MGGKGQLSGAVLSIALLSVSGIAGCDRNHNEEIGTVTDEVIVYLGGMEYSCKADAPDEDRVSDISLMAFDEYGTLEEYRWIPRNDIESAMKKGISLRLCTGKKYSFYGCVNFGKETYASSVEELEELRFHLVYPDDYREGMPMFIKETDVYVDRNCSISLEIRRLMAKISLRLDWSRLSGDVDMTVTGARIGNCPKIVKVFGESSVRNRDDCFTAGFSKNEFEVSPLNLGGTDGKSGEVALYMLENMQGSIRAGDIGKDFGDNDIRRQICSYIEMDMEYLSPDKASLSSPLRYRFYLGGGNDLNVERNCHYHVTVCPEDDGLSRDGWSVDKEGMCTFIREINLSKSEIVFEYEGESILIDAHILPEDSTCKQLHWESSDRNVAEVSGNGTVTSKGEGSCTITCRSPDTAGAYAQCRIKSEFKEYYFNIFPGLYITGNIGESIHVRADFFPPNAMFDIGREELEYDKERGIYDYRIDDDGLGVTLDLLAPGTGILYMSAGYPLNESRAAMVVVNTP